MICSFVLLGDFNVNSFDNSHPLYSKLLLILTSLSLVQVVSEPTPHRCACTLYCGFITPNKQVVSL